MSERCVIYDLDGTLLDTIGEIASSGNLMLEAMGHAARPVADYNLLAGQGLPYMVQHALGSDDPAEIARGCELVQEFRAHGDIAPVQPFDGVAEVLEHFQREGWTQGVFSNKPHEEVVKQVGKFFPQVAFASVLGARPNVPVKPDPAGLIESLERVGMTAEQTVYVGDTAADMLVGSRVGAWTVGVLWGFRDEAELRENGAKAIVHEVAQLAGAIEEGLRKAEKLES
ncbi:MAG: HAD family hydrolase [Planctomycetota bacterium]